MTVQRHNSRGHMATNMVVSRSQDRNGESEMKHAPGEENLERDEDCLQVRLAERRIGDL
jgi:hypothetical protein